MKPLCRCFWGWPKLAAWLALGAVALATEVCAQAPAITAQPRPLAVGPGDRAGFAVTASGEAPLSYQWYHDGVPVTGATGDLVLLPNVRTADAGDYTVRVSNAQGAVVSGSAKLGVAPYTTSWVDSTFQNPGAPVGAPLLLLPDGRVMATNREFFHPVVRLGNDGKLDPTFSFPIDFESYPNIDKSVAKMAQQDDGRLLAIGTSITSTHIGTSQSFWLIRLNEDGSRDGTFAPPPETATQLAQNVLLAIGDKVIVALAEKLVRLNRDGAVDASFTAATTPSPAGDLPAIAAAVIDGAGNFWIGGGGGVWRLRSDGSRDDRFPLVVVGGTVRELALSADGACWVGTTEPDRTSAYHSIYRLRRLTVDGAVDANFHETSLSFPTTNPPALSMQSDGRVVVSGDFELAVPTGEIGREAIHTGVVRLMPDGSVDPTFAPPADRSWSRWLMLPDGTHALAGNGTGVLRMNLSTLGAIEPPRILRVTPSAIKVSAGEDVTVQVVAVGPGTMRMGSGDAGATATIFKDDALTFLDVQGELRVEVDGIGGVATAPIGTDFAASAPRVVEGLEPVVARAGQTAVLNATVRGSYPMDYAWLKDGTVVTRGSLSRYWQGAVNYQVTASGANAGTYALRVTNRLGVTESSAGLSVGPASQLSNFSVRALAGTGENVMIVGFVLKNQKKVFFQAIGPELARYGVAGALADPVATLHLADGTELTNDNGGAPLPWLDPIYAQTGAWMLASPGTRSAELRPDPIDGVNTIVVSGKGAATGVALAQIFDADGTTNRLVNLSARVFSGTGDAAAIAGFIVNGDAPKKVLIRCVGPGLAGSGVSQPLLDPSLTLVDQATHQTLATNNDWGVGTAADVAELRRAMPVVGAFPLAEGSKDAAMVVTLPPGAYTAVVAGAGGTTGIVLLEVYDVP